MPRTARFRSRTVPFTGVKYATLDGVPGAPTIGTYNGTGSCSDYVGRPIVDSGFSSTQSVSTLALDGFIEADKLAGHYNGIQYDHFPFAPVWTGVTLSPLTVNAGWQLSTVAATNPSRPVVTPPELLQDLIELPAMIKHAGDLLSGKVKPTTSKDVANLHLAIRFGWLPLIDDLNKLMHMNDYIQRRMQEIQKLKSGRGLRRRIVINADEQFGKYTTTFSVAVGTSFKASQSQNVSRKQWATIRWWSVPPTGSPTPDDSAYNLARKVVLGLTPEGMAKGAWNVIPWTWMLGWFTNVGQMALANSNTVPAQHSAVCLMNEVKATALSGGITPVGPVRQNSVHISGVATYSAKTRLVSGTITPGFNMPLLDMSKLSILGSLFAQRFLR